MFFPGRKRSKLIAQARYHFAADFPEKNENIIEINKV